MNTNSNDADETIEVVEEEEEKKSTSPQTSPTKNARSLFTFRDVANAVISKKARRKKSSESKDNSHSVEEVEKESSAGNSRTLFTFRDVANAVIAKQKRGDNTDLHACKYIFVVDIDHCSSKVHPIYQ